MILYFSGTGNSLAIARAIAEHVGDKVLPLREAVQTDLSQEQRIGFVYPVYNFNAPAIVPKIVAQLTLPKDAYYFIVCACGAQTGDAIWQVERVLKQKGLTLHYCHKIRVPDNSAIGFGRNPNDQLWKFERFAPRLEQIKTDIAACKSRHHFGSRGLAGVIARRPVFMRMVFDALRPKVNVDKCIGCGICAKVCPVDNICLTSNSEAVSHPTGAAGLFAVNGERCEFCLACVHFCPHQAMELGHKPTLKERQYHHPSIKAKDMIR